MTLPGVSCASFTTNAALGAALRCALSLSIPLPLDQVRLGGTICEDGRYVTFSASDDINTIVVPACASQQQSSSGRRRLSSAASASDVAVVESLSELGPGRAWRLGGSSGGALTVRRLVADSAQLRGRRLADSGSSSGATADVQITIPAGSTNNAADAQSQQQSDATAVVDAPPTRSPKRTWARRPCWRTRCH